MGLGHRSDWLIRSPTALAAADLEFIDVNGGRILASFHEIGRRPESIFALLRLYSRDLR
jgi:hypothetical protein